MPRDESRTTLADYVALAICPALIIGLVASLVFFLTEVLYTGEFLGRLRWILFFFVVGAVLIARISMTGGISERAGMYGLVLGVLVFFGMQIYVAYPKDSAAGQLSWLINLGLIAVVWWSAHRLTADCTQVDDDADVTGKGILQAAGLDELSTEPAQGEKDKPGGWWARYQRYREQQRKKRTLGVWIIWFSLAAFPLFGLGQSLIPPEATGRRQYSFWLMTVYLACGLGLLLTTCFLGLRRYLRQRKAQMPAAVTMTWLVAGGGFAVVLLALGAFLPRPEMEYSLFDLTGTKSPEREASRWAMKGDSPTKGDGRGGNQPKEGENPGEGDGQGKEPGEKGEPTGQSKDGSDKDGSATGKDGSDKGDRNSSSSDNADRRGDAQPGKDQGGEKKSGSGKEGKSGSSSSSPASSSWGDFFKPIAGVLKWIVFAIIAVIVVVVVLRGILRFFANFTGWARGLLDFFNRLWESLFGARPRSEQPSAEAKPATEPEHHAPFSAFPNPFSAALGGAMSREDLIRYTFAAVQAWAREHGVPRRPSETPLEYVNRLSEEVPPLEDSLRRLVMLYGRAVYARGGVPENSTETVREIWDRLEAVAEQPMSA
jgi:hypothetical protein